MRLIIIAAALMFAGCTTSLPTQLDKKAPHSEKDHIPPAKYPPVEDIGE